MLENDRIGFIAREPLHLLPAQSFEVAQRRIEHTSYWHDPFPSSGSALMGRPLEESQVREDCPMTDADLDLIESALGLELPAFYRRFMLDYPRWLAERQPNWSDVEKGELANDPDCVIRFNQYVRGFDPGEFFDDGPWPDHYFVIGSEWDQNWFFLDLSSGSKAVSMYHHDRGEVRTEAETLAEFPAALVEWWEAVERNG